MYTGCNDKETVPELVKRFLDVGYENIEVKKNTHGQWIISTKD